MPPKQTTQIHKEKSSNEIVCYSGGASGSDFEWVKAFGSRSEVFSFSGHSGLEKPNVGEVIHVLKKEELKEADEKLEEANQYLRRKSTNYDLLRRNYHIVKKAESCYAIVNGIGKKTNWNQSSVRIDGGTAWGCQMIVISHIREKKKFNTKNVSIPLYAFCQNENQWYRAVCDMENNVIQTIDWVQIETAPKPTSPFAGIGTRSIIENGKKAIQNLAN